MHQVFGHGSRVFASEAGGASGAIHKRHKSEAQPFLVCPRADRNQAGGFVGGCLARARADTWVRPQHIEQHPRPPLSPRERGARGGCAQTTPPPPPQTPQPPPPSPPSPAPPTTGIITTATTTTIRSKQCIFEVRHTIRLAHEAVRFDFPLHAACASDLKEKTGVCAGSHGHDAYACARPSLPPPWCVCMRTLRTCSWASGVLLWEDFPTPRRLRV